MQHHAGSIPNRIKSQTVFNLLLVVLSLAGSVAVLLSTPHGTSTSPDSISYVTAARSVMEGQGYQTYDGRPFIHWPPLYPTVLIPVAALCDKAGVTIVDGVRWLHAIVFGLTVFASGWLFALQLRSRIVALLGAFAVLCSEPLVLGAFFLLTEPLFTLLTVLFLLMLVYCLRHLSWRTLTITAILVALATLQRYAGLALVVTGGLAFLLLTSKTPVRKQMAYTLAFVAISLTPLLVWLARNYHLTGKLTGFGSEGSPPLRSNISYAQQEITRWFLPPEFGIGYFDLAVLITLALGAYSIITIRRDGRFSLTGLQESLPMPPVLLFNAIFAASVIGAATHAHAFPVSRLLVPTYPAFIGILVAVGDQLIEWSGKSFKYQKQAQAAVIGLLLIALIRPVVLFVDQVEYLSNAHYNRWHESELLAQFRTHPLKGTLYSNIPMAVLLYAGENPEGMPNDITTWPDILTDAPPGTDHFLLWFNDTSWCSAGRERIKEFCYYKLPYNASDLLALPTLQVETIVQAKDGTIYRLSSVAK